jgi:uncharacterized protein (TIGR00369 family)
MNDKPVAAQAQAFDPAGAGWKSIPSVGFGELTGPMWRREEAGRPRFGFVVAQKHLNRAGNLHGGMLMTFADQAMAMTARHATKVPRFATIELNIQFVAAVHIGEFVEAQCEVVRATRAIIFMQVRMLVGARSVVTANGIWKVLDEP